MLCLPLPPTKKKTPFPKNQTIPKLTKFVENGITISIFKYVYYEKYLMINLIYLLHIININVYLVKLKII
jgi:hypothetical protein